MRLLVTGGAGFIGSHFVRSVLSGERDGLAGATVVLQLRCASDSYNFELQSTATHSNGAVSGTWSENTRHVGGNIDGSARGNAINLRVSGVISATLGVSTNANQQSISIQAPGTELQSVAISMSRGVK